MRDCSTLDHRQLSSIQEVNVHNVVYTGRIRVNSHCAISLKYKVRHPWILSPLFTVQQWTVQCPMGSYCALWYTSLINLNVGTLIASTETVPTCIHLNHCVSNQAFHELNPNKPTFASECCSCQTNRGENNKVSGAYPVSHTSTVSITMSPLTSCYQITSIDTM